MCPKASDQYSQEMDAPPGAAGWDAAVVGVWREGQCQVPESSSTDQDGRVGPE